MKIAIAFGLLCALTAVHAVAQTKPAYLVAEFDVTDRAAFKTFAETSLPLVKSHGGQIMSAGAKPVTGAGETPKNAAIIMFESMDKALAYYASPEYQAIIPSRDKGSKFRSYFVEGSAPPQ